jgi:predicted amidohydrolase
MNAVIDTVTVACVNFEPMIGNKLHTRRKMEDVICRAAGKGANIIVFPETALTGYMFSQENLDEIAETVPGPSSRGLAELAAQLDVYVAYGLVERDQKAATVYYNSAAMVGPGSVLGTYRKVHVGAPTELAWCTRGSSFPIFATKYGPIGIGICYDNYCYPEVARTYALGGARLLLNPTAFSNFPDTTTGDMLAYYMTTLGARSIENKIFVASANLVGIEMGTAFLGQSVILGPKRGCSHYYVWGGPAGQDEEIVMATLDLSTPEKLPPPTQNIFRDRRPDTYSLLCEPMGRGS